MDNKPNIGEREETERGERGERGEPENDDESEKIRQEILKNYETPEGYVLSGVIVFNDIFNDNKKPYFQSGGGPFTTRDKNRKVRNKNGREATLRSIDGEGEAQTITVEFDNAPDVISNSLQASNFVLASEFIRFNYAPLGSFKKDDRVFDSSKRQLGTVDSCVFQKQDSVNLTGFLSGANVKWDNNKTKTSSYIEAGKIRPVTQDEEHQIRIADLGLTSAVDRRSFKDLLSVSQNAPDHPSPGRTFSELQKPVKKSQYEKQKQFPDVGIDPDYPLICALDVAADPFFYGTCVELISDDQISDANSEASWRSCREIMDNFISEGNDDFMKILALEFNDKLFFQKILLQEGTVLQPGVAIYSKGSHKASDADRSQCIDFQYCHFSSHNFPPGSTCQPYVKTRTGYNSSINALLDPPPGQDSRMFKLHSVGPVHFTQHYPGDREPTGKLICARNKTIALIHGVCDVVRTDGTHQNVLQVVNGLALLGRQDDLTSPLMVQLKKQIRIYNYSLLEFQIRKGVSPLRLALLQPHTTARWNPAGIPLVGYSEIACLDSDAWCSASAMYCSGRSSLQLVDFARENRGALQPMNRKEIVATIAEYVGKLIERDPKRIKKLEETNVADFREKKANATSYQTFDVVTAENGFNVGDVIKVSSEMIKTHKSHYQAFRDDNTYGWISIANLTPHHVVGGKTFKRKNIKKSKKIRKTKKRKSKKKSKRRKTNKKIY
jgi:hypothetical protein